MVLFFYKHSGLLALCSLMLLGGCATFVTPPSGFKVYDLGSPGSLSDLKIRQAPGISLAPEEGMVPISVEVRAPSWLSTSSMQYRLDFRPPSSRETYAESRWAGQPAEMLQRVLQAHLGTVGPESSVRLRVEIDEFIQRFDSLRSSSSEIIVRAAVLAPREERVLAREQFVIQVPTTSANAAGGVVAHQMAATQLAEEIRLWLVGLALVD